MHPLLKKWNTKIKFDILKIVSFENAKPGLLKNMNIGNFDAFTADLGRLMRLSSPIALSEIPVAFREDVVSFIAGQTLVKNAEGQLLVSEKTIRRWTKKILERGFDYEIDLKTYGNK